jgi:hypothetical protein
MNTTTQTTIDSTIVEAIKAKTEAREEIRAALQNLLEAPTGTHEQALRAVELWEQVGASLREYFAGDEELERRLLAAVAL